MSKEKTSAKSEHTLINFNPYVFRIENQVIEKWFIPVFGPFILSILIAIPIYISGNLPSFMVLGENVIYLFVASSLGVLVYLYNLWVMQIPGVFLKIKGQFLKPPVNSKTKKNYDDFIGKYLLSLHSPWRYVLILPVQIFIIFILVNMVNHPTDVANEIKYLSFQEKLGFLKIAYVVIYYVGSALIWAYLSMVCAWIMVVTAWYLWKLPREFEIKVEPRHLDKCGGLGFIGEFCLGLSYPILGGAFFLAILGVSGDVIGYRVSSAISDGAIFALVFIAMPLLYISFFVPIWGIHKEMLLRKKEFIKIGNEHIRQLKTKLEMSIEKGDFAEAKTFISELDSLASYYSSIPVLPFNYETIRKFLSPQIVPVLGIIFKFETITQTNLTAILDMFN